MAPTPHSPVDLLKRIPIPPPWYYWTRFLGSLLVLYGLAFDTTGERGTLIITGAGLLGIDKVARSEPPASG